MGIQAEIEAFCAMQSKLEAEHFGQWVVFHDRKLVDFFESFEAAANEAVILFGSGPFLIRQIGAPPLNLPISAVFC